MSIYDVFIAHAGADGAPACALHAALKARGRMPFVDELDLLPGDPWDEVLPEVLADSRVAVILVGATTDKAWFQREEIALAIAHARNPAHRQRVIPVYLSGIAATTQMPYGLRRLNGLDWPALGGALGVAAEILRVFPEGAAALGPLGWAAPPDGGDTGPPPTSAPVYLSSVDLTDIRCFPGTQTIPLSGRPGWFILAGKNGAGKTTALKSIVVALMGASQATALTGNQPFWVRSGCTGARISVHASCRGEILPFPVQFQRQSDTEAATDAGGRAAAPPFFLAAYGSDRLISSGAPGGQPDPVLGKVANLFQQGAPLVEAVGWLKQIQLRALEGRPGALPLLNSILDLLNDGLLPDGSLAESVNSDGLWIKRDHVRLRLEQVSDGYRAVAALVVDLLQRLHTAAGDLQMTGADGHLVCPLPGIVLIDEIDAHLHVSWQQQIGWWLTSRFPAIQFIVTTHSPFICQAASPGGLIRLPAPGEARTIGTVDARLHTAIVNGGADDAVMSELFGLEHAHSPQAEALRRQIAAIETKLLLRTATPEERAEYQRLKALLPDDMEEVADRKLRALRASAA